MTEDRNDEANSKLRKTLKEAMVLTIACDTPFDSALVGWCAESSACAAGRWAPKILASSPLKLGMIPWNQTSGF